MAKILIVEDDPLIVKIYTTRLSADGHTVISADNGADGVTKALESVPDVVLLDIMMPKLDGFGFMQAVRKDPKTAHIPLLVYSNLSNDDEIKRAKDSGATEFLMKTNLTPNQVVEKIKQYLPK